MENSFVKEVLGYLLGTITPAQWVAALIFAFIGIAISTNVFTKARDKESSRTPDKFSLKFWIKDNLQRMTLNTLLVLVYLRFGPELLGTEVTMIVALFIGVSIDRLGIWLREKNILDPKK